MFNTATFDLLGLDQALESYDYNTDPLLQEHFRPIEEALWTLIEHYGAGVNDFGRQMADHLRRTSLDGMRFLVDELGFSERAGWNFHAANLFQDLGKIHSDYDPTIWDLPHRPSEEERAEKRKHTKRGPEVFDIALEEAPPALREHPHIRSIIPAIQLFHHERVDGTGPFGRTGDQMGLVIKTAVIVDVKDGDMVKRGHHELRRTETETLLRMKSLSGYDDKGKYRGAFDSLLDRYIAYRERAAGHPILPANLSAAS